MSLAECCHSPASALDYTGTSHQCLTPTFCSSDTGSHALNLGVRLRSVLKVSEAQRAPPELLPKPESESPVAIAMQESPVLAPKPKLTKEEEKKLKRQIKQRGDKEFKDVSLSPKRAAQLDLPEHLKHQPVPPTPPHVRRSIKRKYQKDGEYGHSLSTSEDSSTESDSDEEDRKFVEGSVTRAQPLGWLALAQESSPASFRMQPHHRKIAKVAASDGEDDIELVDNIPKKSKFVSTEAGKDRRSEEEIEAEADEEEEEELDFFWAVPSGSLGLSGKQKLHVHDDSVEGGVRLATAEEQRIFDDQYGDDEDEPEVAPAVQLEHKSASGVPFEDFFWFYRGRSSVEMGTLYIRVHTRENGKRKPTEVESSWYFAQKELREPSGGADVRGLRLKD